MNRPKFAVRYYILIAILAIILMLAIAAGLQNFVREAIAIPLSYILWLGDIIFQTIPQGTLLALLLIIILYIGLRSLSAEKKVKRVEKLYEAEPPGRNRVSFWISQVHMLRGTTFARDRFSYILTKLVLDVLAHDQRLTRLQLEDAIEDGQLDVPLELKVFVLSRQQVTSYSSGGFLARLARALTQFWQKARYRPASSQASIDQANLEKTIQYLEQQLEIKHE